MEETLIKAGQLFLSLAILITLHEMGHFIAARIFGTRVEKFYLFFNPWFSLVKKRIGETEYGIGWIPLGGYVKIAGMIDESMDKEQMQQPAQPWEFRAKPAWQRLIIMLGGITVNLLLGWFIYAMLLYSVGESYIPARNAAYGIQVDSLGYKMGLRNGDKIINVEGQPIEKLNDVFVKVMLNDARRIEVNRDGQTVDVVVPDSVMRSLVASRGGVGISERFPFVVEKVERGTPAYKAQLQPNDVVIAVGGNKAVYYDEVREQLHQHAGQTTNLTVVRNRDTLKQAVQLGADGLLGVNVKQPYQLFDTKTVQYSLAQAFPAGLQRAWSTLDKYVSSFKLIFSKKTQGYKHLRGFIGIGDMFAPVWDWVSFWELTAFLSLVLAFMNLLPIPALDGGHVMFTLYEMIARRKPNEKFLEYAQITGMVILFSLMLYVNGNDLLKAFR